MFTFDNPKIQKLYEALEELFPNQSSQVWCGEYEAIHFPIKIYTEFSKLAEEGEIVIDTTGVELTIPDETLENIQKKSLTN